MATVPLLLTAAVGWATSPGPSARGAQPAAAEDRDDRETRLVRSGDARHVSGIRAVHRCRRARQRHMARSSAATSRTRAASCGRRSSPIRAQAQDATLLGAGRAGAVESERAVRRARSAGGLSPRGVSTRGGGQGGAGRSAGPRVAGGRVAEQTEMEGSKTRAACGVRSNRLIAIGYLDAGIARAYLERGCWHRRLPRAAYGAHGEQVPLAKVPRGRPRNAARSRRPSSWRPSDRSRMSRAHLSRAERDADARRAWNARSASPPTVRAIGTSAEARELLESSPARMTPAPV